MIGTLGRITFLIVAVALIVALAACSGEEYEPPAPAQPAAEPQAASGESAPVQPQTPAQPAPVAPAQPAAEALGMAMTVSEESAPAPTSAPAQPAPAAPAPAPQVVEVEVMKEVVKEVQGQGQMMQAAAMAAAPQQMSGSEGFNTIGGSSTVNDAAYDLTFFKHYGVNPFVDTEDDHLSTFAIDVDTASYSVARRFVQDGNLPHPDSVRVEEFVNYFDQSYSSPERNAFAIHMEAAPSRFGSDKHWLMRIGLQGMDVSSDDRKDATLVFAIDVSGSMAREDRLGLVKRSLRLLVDELRSRDEVGIVIYGDYGSVLLEPTDGGEQGAILAAIDALQPGGSTYVEDGLRLAYDMAVKRVQPGRITRVLLLSDGVGNVGRTGSDSILNQIRSRVDQGVTLTTVGFGMGNYNDVLMEQLANDGDGSYHYVDSLSEARRIFVEGLVGTLQVIARDTKIQVDFNPQVVSRYRLLGYENRRVADEDFRNDAVDAGEVGADHSVTALYELKLHDTQAEPLGTVYARYQDPDSGEVIEVKREFAQNELVSDFRDTSPTFQLAAVVAEYAEILRESYWAQDGDLDDVADEANRLRNLLRSDPDVAEFANLVSRAASIQAEMGGG